MVETSGRAAEEGSLSQDRQTCSRCSKTEQQIIVYKLCWQNIWYKNTWCKCRIMNKCSQNKRKFLWDTKNCWTQLVRREGKCANSLYCRFEKSGYLFPAFLFLSIYVQLIHVFSSFNVLQKHLCCRNMFLFSSVPPAASLFLRIFDEFAVCFFARLSNVLFIVCFTCSSYVYFHVRHFLIKQCFEACGNQVGQPRRKQSAHSLITSGETSKYSC